MSNPQPQQHGKKNKLSVWVRKIMQPAKETTATTNTTTTTTTTTPAQPNQISTTDPTQKKIDWENSTINSSLRPMITKDSNTQRSNSEVTEEPKSRKRKTEDELMNTDNASMQPLVSVYSSSIKSSTFSDVHSNSSTKATVMSSKTQETNSSTVAIPPASIMDRTRRSSTTNTISSAANRNTPSTNRGTPRNLQIPRNPPSQNTDHLLA